jgi:hypothetical protein
MAMPKRESSHVSSMSTRKRRAPRNKALPSPPQEIQTPYANCRAEWQGVGLGEKVRVILDSDPWQRVMVPELERLDAERSRKGPAPAYTAEELERAVLFQKIAGVATYKEARNLLAGDREADTRQLLGFDKPRKRYGKGVTLVKSLDGVPSEVTVWRHLQRWDLERQVQAYDQLFQALLEEHLADPDMRTEARTLNIDGSVIRSHYTSWTTVNRETGEIIREPTLEGGGFMPRTETNAGQDGHGFTMVSVTTSTGLPLAHRIVPLATKDQTEPDTALRLFREDWPERVQPHLDPKLSVLSADAAYKKTELRAQLRQLGIVENCHPVSHADRESSQENAEAKDQMVWEIQGYPDWRANGHREIYCVCGKSRTFWRVSRDGNGRAVVRTEGSCSKCGSITITSGKWRAARNPRRFTRCQPEETEADADWSFGNPLTFNDPTSRAFGRGRFGHGEGFHGHLQTRFGLLKHKAWYRRRQEAERDFLMVFAGMHALAMEQRKRAREITSSVTASATELAPEKKQRWNCV